MRKLIKGKIATDNTLRVGAIKVSLDDLIVTVDDLFLGTIEYVLCACVCVCVCGCGFTVPEASRRSTEHNEQRINGNRIYCTVHK